MPGLEDLDEALVRLARDSVFREVKTLPDLLVLQSENGELPGTWQPGGAGFGGDGGSGGWLEGDGLPEFFELADVGALAVLGVDAGGVETRSEIAAAGAGVG